MELTAVHKVEDQIIDTDKITTISKGNFIEANTKQVSLEHLTKECIIPVYSDNETTIAHSEFIRSMQEVTQDCFPNQTLLEPNIRISHTIKGRVPSALGKPLKELTEDETTIYYQRCAFMMELPDLKENVNNNSLSLTIGGVRALNQENLYSKRSMEKFKIFIGYKNAVCTNLCIATDGLNSEVRVSSVSELKDKIASLIESFDNERFLGNMERMSKFSLNEIQFAHTIGKMRMFQHLNKEERDVLFPLMITDNQIGTLVKEYYQDANFSRTGNKTLNLWHFYNLMTSCNKSTYIDSALERNVNAYAFINELSNSMQNESENWFLN